MYTKIKIIRMLMRSHDVRKIDLIFKLLSCKSAL